MKSTIFLLAITFAFIVNPCFAQKNLKTKALKSVISTLDQSQEVIKNYYNLSKKGDFIELEKLVDTNYPDKDSADKQSFPKSKDPKSDAPNPAILNSLQRNYLVKDLPRLIQEGKWSLSKIETLVSKPTTKAIKVELAHQIDTTYKIAIVFRLFQNKNSEWKIYETAFIDTEKSSKKTK